MARLYSYDTVRPSHTNAMFNQNIYMQDLPQDPQWQIHCHHLEDQSYDPDGCHLCAEMLEDEANTAGEPYWPSPEEVYGYTGMGAPQFDSYNSNHE